MAEGAVASLLPSREDRMPGHYGKVGNRNDPGRPGSPGGACLPRSSRDPWSDQIDRAQGGRCGYPATRLHAGTVFPKWIRPALSRPRLRPDGRSEIGVRRDGPDARPDPGRSSLGRCPGLPRRPRSGQGPPVKPPLSGQTNVSDSIGDLAGPPRGHILTSPPRQRHEECRAGIELGRGGCRSPGHRAQHVSRPR